METNDNKKNAGFLNQLKENFFFNALNPQKNQKDIYCTDIKFSQYAEMLYAVKYLLQIALHTLYEEMLYLKIARIFKKIKMRKSITNYINHEKE